MEQNILTVETRDGLGKGPSRRIRRAGKLPGVLYGLGEQKNIVVDPRLIKNTLLQEGGKNRVFNLSGSGIEGKHALIKDFQIDPVTRVLLHVDLMEIDVTKKIQVTVALNFVGKSIGVADGGVLNIVERNLTVRCLPNQIPSHIDVDVTPLKIADSIHLDQLTMPEGIERAVAQNITLVTVVPPSKEEDAAPSLTQAAEPEVITAKAPAADAAEGDKKEEKKK